MGSDSSDFELLDAWGAGDASAGRALYERYCALLYRFIRTKVYAGAEDLSQNVWLACVEGRERFRREGSFRAYLLQTARFQLYAHYRKQRSTELDFSASSVAALATSPSAVVLRHQEERLLLEALRNVSLEDQILLELRFWEELSGPEIAEIMDAPEPVVRGRVRRATERLRTRLQTLAGQNAAPPGTQDDLQKWAQRLREALAARDGQ